MKKTVAQRHKTYSRRAATAIGLAALAAGRSPAPVQGAPLPAVSQPVSGTRIDVRDERFRSIISEPNPLIERIAAGFRFIEGPVWVENSLLFVDNQLNSIFRLRDLPGGPEVTIFRYPAGFPLDQPRPAGVGGYGPNGLALDRQGRLLVTEHGNRRITRTDPAGPGSVMVFDPQGTLLGRIILPERPVNCGFGGPDWKTLYMTARTGLYRVRSAMPGIPIP
jgi:sugar lactone lactonase YvrE